MELWRQMHVVAEVRCICESGAVWQLCLALQHVQETRHARATQPNSVVPRCLCPTAYEVRNRVGDEGPAKPQTLRLGQLVRAIVMPHAPTWRPRPPGLAPIAILGAHDHPNRRRACFWDSKVAGARGVVICPQPEMRQRPTSEVQMRKRMVPCQLRVEPMVTHGNFTQLCRR